MASIHCWKRQLSQVDLNKARELKEPVREKVEPKKMFAEALLKNSVLGTVTKEL